MWYLYLDESGDLGFDFFAKKPSRFFTVTVLTVNGIENNKHLMNAVKRTIKRKLPHKQSEMKGAKDSIKVKEYFYRQVSAIPFDIYSVTLNKRRVYDSLAKQKDRVCNFIARNVLDKIPVENASSRIAVIIDKSKSKAEIREFNEYIVRHIKGRIDPRIPLDIYHWTSHENMGIQAVDTFSWGYFENTRRKITNGSIYLRERCGMIQSTCLKNKKERALRAWCAMAVANHPEGNTIDNPQRSYRSI